MDNLKRNNITVVGIGITFNNEGKILMTKRYSPATPYSHDKWQFPGGVIEYGEDPSETAKREIWEETNIVIDVDKSQTFVASHVYEEAKSHVILIAYKATYVSGEIDVSRDELTGEGKWMLPDEINYTTCLPKTKELLDKVLIREEKQ